MRTSPAIALAVTAALLTGCAAAPGAATGRPAEPSTPGAPTQAAHHAEDTAAAKDPVEVGKTFVTAAYTWDTRTGTHLTEALKRVEYMATDELAAQFVESKHATGGAAWDQAARHRAHTEPEVSIVPDGNQAVTKPQQRIRTAGYMVSWNWKGPDAYQQNGGKELVILTLTDTIQGWKVTSFEPTPFP